MLCRDLHALCSNIVQIADWVADSILNKEDSRRRATCIKQFINIADVSCQYTTHLAPFFTLLQRCRSLHNYSTMVAITSGLNTPPIRRLKRTWELVNARFMSQLGACEMTIDSNKNFNNYRLTLASVTPPFVPFIGKISIRVLFQSWLIVGLRQVSSLPPCNLFRTVVKIIYPLAS